MQIIFQRSKVSISYGTKTATSGVLADNTGFAFRHSYLISIPTVNGTFSFRIPFKYILDFCEYYDKIVYGSKHTLSRVRKTDNDAIFRDAAADVGKVTLDKILWFVPNVIPADAEKFSIYKTIEWKVELSVAYRSRQCDMFSVPESKSFTWRMSVKTSPEKPKYIILGFQTAKDGDQSKNPTSSSI